MMTDFKTLNGLMLGNDIIQHQNILHLNFLKQDTGFDIFKFVDQQERPLAIGDEADYLKLYMQIAVGILRETGTCFKTYLVAADIGGHHLFLKEFTEKEKEEYKYAHVALLHAFKQLSEDLKPETFSFFGELNLVDASEEKFEKESQKTARILSGKIRENWQEIAEKRCLFLKTDVYVYSLLKLFSWGFQAIDANGEIREDQNLVRPKRPTPRGTSRK
jgi:hypothetical protein